MDLDADEGEPNMAHHKGGESHFSGSLLKVAAVYALFELRATLRMIAIELGTSATPRTFLQAADDHIWPIIKREARKLSPLAHAPERELRPRLVPRPVKTDHLFDVTARSASSSVKVNVDFTAHRNSDLERIFNHPHSNIQAGRLIHGVGYGYINLCLQHAGLLRTAGKPEGMWLAGDYWPAGQAGKYNAHDIDAKNHTPPPAAQVTTAIDMARLVYEILTQRPQRRAREMRERLRESRGMSFIGHKDDLSFTPLHEKFRVRRSKVGLGTPTRPGGGQQVMSEAAVLRHRVTKSNYLLIYQNLIEPDDDGDPDDPNVVEQRKFSRGIVEAIHDYEGKR